VFDIRDRWDDREMRARDNENGENLRRTMYAESEEVIKRARAWWLFGPNYMRSTSHRSKSSAESSQPAAFHVFPSLQHID
jgi:hypothetical protein